MEGFDPTDLDTANPERDGDAVIPNWRTATLVASSLAVMYVGSVATHLAAPGEGDAGREAAEHVAVTLPPLFGPLAALALLGLVRAARRQSLGPAWYLLLPPLAFGLQELTERLVNGQMPEPTILAIALVQVPFALVAYLLARLLRGAVLRVARFLTTPSDLPRPRLAGPSWPAAPLSFVHVPTLVGAHRGRAPPTLR